MKTARYVTLVLLHANLSGRCYVISINGTALMKFANISKVGDLGAAQFVKNKKIPSPCFPAVDPNLW
jgi:hypothetical protein